MNNTSPILRENYRLLNEFDSSFWSGLDLQVYMGNIWLRDAVQVAYQVLETLQPYYHYSSYTPNRISHGIRLIQGEFTINFTRHSYIPSLLSRFSGNILLPENSNLPPQVSAADAGTMGSKAGQVGTNQPAREIATGNMTADQKRQFALSRKKALSQEEELRSQINNAKPAFRSDRGLFETDVEFDLNLVFGAFLARPLRLKYTADEREYYLDGAVVQDNRPDPGPYGTGLRIQGVHLQNSSMTMGDDGRPIMETYSFLAKNISILYDKDLAAFPDYVVAGQVVESQLGSFATIDDVMKMVGGYFSGE